MWILNMFSRELVSPKKKFPDTKDQKYFLKVSNFPCPPPLLFYAISYKMLYYSPFW